MIVIDGPRCPIKSLAFHPDGSRIAAAGGRFFWTTFWDATTGALLGQWPATSPGLPGNIAFHPSGRWLYCASGGLRGLIVVDVATGEHADDDSRGSGPPAHALAVSPGGERVLVAGSHGLVTSLRATGLAPAREWSIEAGAGSSVEGVAVFPDGAKFVSAEHGDTVVGPLTFLRLRSAADGSVLDKIGPDCGIPQQVAVSPDGVWVALRAAASLLVFHLTESWKSVKHSSPNRKHLTALAFHPSGRYLAATSNDHTVRLHDRDAEWAVSRTFDWDIGKLKSVAFNADGTLAAAGGDTGKVVVWDVDL